MGTDGEIIEPYDPETATRSLADIVLDALRRDPHAPRDPEAFLDWAASTEPTASCDVSRFVVGVWRRRSDLSDLVPGLFLDPAASPRLQLWAHHFLVAETGAPEALRPNAPVGVTEIQEPSLDRAPPLLLPGTVVVGYLRAVLGLGDAGRRLARLLAQSGERVRSLSYDHVDAPLIVPWPNPERSDIDDLDIVILAVNGAEISRVARALGAHARHGRYVIGLWFWELEELSDDMAQGFAAVDEVWVTSEFTADAVRRAAPARVAVRVIPLGADPATQSRGRRTDVRDRFGIPLGVVVVGNVFDHASRIERKNPIGLIDAWKLAYPQADPAVRVLFVKSMNADTFPDAHEAVLVAAAGRTDVIVHDEFLAAADRDALAAEFDVVASLHRSEGYGLTLLDAMLRGVPVIASRYSGNLAFMTDDTAWLVPVTRTTLTKAAGPYPAGGTWAEPDLQAGARALREVVDGIDSAPVRARVERARESVRTLIDGTDGVAFVKQRLTEIRAQR